MSERTSQLADLVGEQHAATGREYSAGFVTEIEAETLPPGLDETVVRAISGKKEEPEWMTEWRLDALRRWQQMRTPRWAHVQFPDIDFPGHLVFLGPEG